jgi:hypothetical protein
MYGHWTVGYSESNKSIYSFDCEFGQSSLQKFAVELEGKVTYVQNFKHKGKQFVAMLMSQQKYDSIALV